LVISALGWRLAMAMIAIPVLMTAVLVRVSLDETTATPSATLRGALSRQLLLVAVTLGIVSTVGRSFLTLFHEDACR